MDSLHTELVIRCAVIIYVVGWITYFVRLERGNWGHPLQKGYGLMQMEMGGMYWWKWMMWMIGSAVVAYAVTWVLLLSFGFVN